MNQNLKIDAFNFEGNELAFVGSNCNWNRLVRDGQFASKTYEPVVTSLVCSHSGDVFIDIGAYLGYFAILSSKSFGKVYAIEAQPLRFGALAYNSGFYENIYPLWGFVGEKPPAPFSPSHMSGELFYTRNNKADAPNLDFKFDNVSLDDLVRPEDDVMIKIDVEGGEDGILGLCTTELIRNEKVKWIIEVHHRVTDPDLIKSKFHGRKLTEFGITREISKLFIE